MIELFAITLYLVLLFSFAKWKQKKGQTGEDFLIGSRCMGKWTTALAAHASDMSNWLFMAYPGMVFLIGGQYIWAAIGLTLIMWMNWIFIAPKIRIQSEKAEAITLCGFFESRLEQQWSSGRLVISLAQFLFYIVYVAAILSGLAMLLETLFPISYFMGAIIGIALVVPLLLIGGYATLAEVDLFQGLFLLFVILFVPLFVLGVSGNAARWIETVHSQGKSFSPFHGSLLSNVFLMFGWGLGYFGQPHIITKFMGIRDPNHLVFSKRIGISWQIVSLFAATLIGFVGIAFLPHLANEEMVFITLVRSYFHPFVSGIFLCAILAAILNAMSSMLLVLSTTLSEDLYNRFSKKKLTNQKQLNLARGSCVVAALCSLGIALPHFASINKLVLYAWSGLGATFGPLLIASLYFKRLNKNGALFGMVTGGVAVCLWPLINREIPSLIVAFPLSILAIFFGSRVLNRKPEKVQN